MSFEHSPSHRRLGALGGLASLAALVSTQALCGQQAGYTFLGAARSYERLPSGIIVRTEEGSLRVDAIAGVGLRVRVRFDSGGATAFPPTHSLATGDTEPSLGTAKVREDADTIVVAGEGLVASVSRHPVRLAVRDAAGHELLRESFGAGSQNGRLAHVIRDAPGARYFGLGEQPMSLDRRGSVFPFWNTDRYEYRPGDVPIYSSIPFYLRILDGVVHGVLYDNPFRGEMDFAARLKETVTYTADGGLDGGELRYYVIAGPRLDSTLARYTRLTGRTPLPPRWALGYQQSRYSYFPDTTVLDLAREFRRRDIPADVLYLDIDYMNGFRVFTWSPTNFPRPRQMLDTLAAQGFKVVTIVDPGVKVDSGYAVYRDLIARRGFVALPDGTPYVGDVWPGRSVFPDFSRAAVREWWGGQQAPLIDTGVRGIWNDMNEPSVFGGLTMSDLALFQGDGQPGPHLEYHNQYGTLMARASFEGLRRLRPTRRPLVITRAAYTGVQRYSSVWTGDNTASWEHLRLSLSMILSLGLSGVPFAGSDIGGFVGAPSADLYARWLQSAALIPFCRTHAFNGSPRREPWSYGREYERANRATIRLRYRLLPALYTAFHQHTRNGSPVVRPLFWDAQDDSAAFSVQDAYMLGDHLLAAPVVDSGAQERSVSLPPGRWYRLGSDDAFDGGHRVTVPAPSVAYDGGDTTGLRGLPIFVSAGAVIPMQTVVAYDGARQLDTLELEVYPGTATSELYEDVGDGYGYQQGEYRSTVFRTVAEPRRLTIALARSGAFAGATLFGVTIHDSEAPRRAVVDGRAIRTEYDAQRRTIRFTVRSGVQRIEVAR